MKLLTICIVLVVAACTPEPAKFSAPPKDAPSWALNTDRMQGTNDLIKPGFVR